MFIGYSVHGEKITALKIAAHGEWPATWSGWMRSEWCAQISGGVQQFTVGVHWNGQAAKMKYMVIRQIVEVSTSAGLLQGWAVHRNRVLTVEMYMTTKKNITQLQLPADPALDEWAVL